MKIDLHIHSMYSGDGVLSPEQIVRIAREKGLNGVAITDHDTIRGGQEAKRFETEDFKVIIGAEILTDRGEITGLFLSREIQARRIREVAAEIRAQGGMVIVPHPFDKLRKSAFHVTGQYIDIVDAIEGFNARCIRQQYNKRAIEFAVKNGLPIVGGSDAHYANEIGLGGIITQSNDVRRCIEQDELKLFGKPSSVMNHVRTKFRKWQKRITSQI